MKSIYVSTPNTKISVKENQLVIEKSNTEVFEYPILEVDKLVVTTTVSLSSKVLSTLLFYKIPTYFLSRTGRYFGKLDGYSTNKIQKRISQYDFYSNGKIEDKIFLIQKTILTKIHNSYVLAKRWATSHSIEIRNLELNYLNSKNYIPQIKDIEKLRGYEGMFSRVYFEHYRLFLRNKFGFKERNRNPPKDPINSLLSFGYTLLSQDIVSSIEEFGLEPYLGFYHSIKYNNPALAFDLMEEFRSIVVDSIVIDLVNHSSVNSDDFDLTENGVFINDELKRKFIKKYEEKRSSEYKVEESKLTYKEIFDKKIKSYYTFLKSSDKNDLFWFEIK